MMARRPRSIVTAMLALGLASGLAPVAPGAAPSPPQQVFRSAANAISVPVAVLRDGQPVSDLPLEEFALFDNGVMQEVALMSVGALPIDVTLVLDSSGSVSGETMWHLSRDMAAIVSGLAPEDRVRLLTFSHVVDESMPLRLAGTEPPLGRATTGGSTAFYNAVAAALLPRAEPGRPHLVVALGDGGDNASWLTPDDVRELARYADVVLHVVVRNRSANAPRASASQAGYGWLPFTASVFSDGLEEAAELTGGAYHRVSGGTPLTGLFTELVHDFKAGYLLWYEPKGVALPGWHELTVRIKRGGHEVRARRGYFGG